MNSLIAGVKPQGVFLAECVRGATKFCAVCERVLPYENSVCSKHPSIDPISVGGDLAWEAEAHNIVVTAGKNALLDATFKTGIAAPAWYVGLKGTGTPDPADTMASHGTWTTITPYSNANDPAYTGAAPSAGSMTNAASKAVFNINAGSTVFGAFIKDLITKGGATGTLYCAADFSGSRAVISGDTLNVTYVISAT